MSCSRTGEEITASAIISNADPKRTLLKLVDPSQLSPDFVMKLQHYRMPGTVAKVNLALSGLPKFTALEGENHDRALSSRIHIGPEIDYLERAFDESKYGNFSKQPYLEVAIPSLTDPGLAPEGKHVMSIYMQYAPYKLKGSDWEKQRVPLGDTVVKTLAQYAPNLPELILTHQIITPQDLEETYGLTGGHIFHGELSLDQFFTMRPLLDWSRYRTPDPESLPVRLRNASRRRFDRRLRRQRGTRNPERPEKVSHPERSVVARLRATMRSRGPLKHHWPRGDSRPRLSASEVPVRLAFRIAADLSAQLRCVDQWCSGVLSEAATPLRMTRAGCSRPIVTLVPLLPENDCALSPR